MPLSKPICFPHIIPKGENSRFTYKCTTKWCLIRSQVDQIKFNIFLKALQQKSKAGLLYRKCAEMWNLSAFPYNTALCKREFVFSNLKRLLSVSLKCFATPWSKLKRNVSSSRNICVRRIIDIVVFLRKSLLCLETIVRSNFPKSKLSNRIAPTHLISITLALNYWAFTSRFRGLNNLWRSAFYSNRRKDPRHGVVW